MREHCSVYLHPKDLERIVVRRGAISQLQWKEKNEEFYLDEVLYDVISQRKYADSTVYFCVRDREEQHVINRLNLLVKQEHGKAPGVFSQMLKILFSLYFTAPVQEHPYISTEERQVNFAYADHPHFLWYCRPDVPPPWSR